jgi:hypothetical protein
VAYVKDERANLQTCASTLNCIISCNGLGMFKPFDGVCLGHALSKIYQYTTTDGKVALGFNYASIKFAQTNIEKCII